MSDFRMLDLNKVFMCGRLTRDPELRYLPNGTAVVKVCLAVSKKYTKSSGEKGEETLFINVEAWSKQAEFVNQYFAKGRPMFVEGRLKSRSWETDDGQKRSIVEIRADRIQFMDWVEQKDDSPGETEKPDEATPTDQQHDVEHDGVEDDDVPF